MNYYDLISVVNILVLVLVIQSLISHYLST